MAKYRGTPLQWEKVSAQVPTQRRILIDGKMVGVFNLVDGPGELILEKEEAQRLLLAAQLVIDALDRPPTLWVNRNARRAPRS